MMAKNKTQKTTIADLIADSEPAREVVMLGKNPVTIQELSGRERFELSTKAEDDRWDTLVWMCMKSMVDPAPESAEELNKINPKWVVKIATAAMKLSGIDVDTEELGNESADVIDIGGS